ncbi:MULTISPECIES: hypothetical protein [Streptomyces]|uniref:Uncharacterized protein n=1 Tax=Streptomyces koelreuteriae TaxID=2838015 RepID=A0ABX8G0X7_9ACTN|nr:MULTISPECIES: hypothetical protein [Streptomyces]QWB27163.1 hypothetical protein KJK29_33730 [Streptomyces koelreuteriae]UUA10243.1 hypothetical protein NNW98_33920 [Streptomyces koelreuteriae]UUA17849.1 hypothetical protein NNW99_33805 [Streptomyces sp. CRCS-T-1]
MDGDPGTPLREVPRFHDEINGTGSDVVHYRGEPGPGVLRYEGPSMIQLEALDDRLAYRVTLVEGSAGERTFQWPAAAAAPCARPSMGSARRVT